MYSKYLIVLLIVSNLVEIYLTQNNTLIPNLFYSKKLRNTKNIDNSFKTIISYENNGKYYVEIVSKYEYSENPLSPVIYRHPNKIKLSPEDFVAVIEFISTNLNSNFRVINPGLKISKFSNPFHIIIWKPINEYNKKYRIQIFDWLEIKDLITVSSEILYEIYEYNN